MFIPIGIIIDVSEKINFMIENKIPFLDIAIYYYILPYILLIAYFLFFSCFIDYLVYLEIANNTEIIAI
jgi:lipopolysaccharide export system permease protein